MMTGDNEAEVLLGWEVAERAYADFDAWLAGQPDEVQDMGLLDQINIYAKAMQ